MSVEFLARLQFAFTISFHYFYPPMSIGLSIILVLMEAIWIKTRNPLYHNMARFWTRIFALSFAIGVPTGIVMEFEFGTNWSTYSRFVGDVFGSPLAAEGIFAFFLESGFLAILLFGWDRVGPKLHFLSTCMVALGSHFSAIWIVVANSWMQTPAAYHLVRQSVGPDGTLLMLPNGTVAETPLPPDYVFHSGDRVRAVVESFWGMVFNPSSMQRLCHVVLGAWLTGAFVVLSISAYYLLRRRHLEFARASMKVALAFGCITSLLQLVSADATARGVAVNQPVKLAALEGVWQTRPYVPLGIVGFASWTRDAQGQIVGGTTTDLNMPGMLSILVSGNFTHPFLAAQTVVPGLLQIPSDQFILARHPGATPDQLPTLRATYWPNVPVVYQTYHLMIAIGMALIGITLAGVFLWWRGLLWKTDLPITRWYLCLLVPSVLLPQIANQAGWYTAELGRQPWIVYNLLKTSDSFSQAVKANEIVISIVGFGLVYVLLFILFIYLLNAKIHHGPSSMEQSSALPEKWDYTTQRGHIADV
jgi:cytochrome d ubiquinol oxidase subunit I